jgi:hypothetical protein
MKPLELLLKPVLTMLLLAIVPDAANAQILTVTSQDRTVYYEMGASENFGSYWTDGESTNELTEAGSWSQSYSVTAPGCVTLTFSDSQQSSLAVTSNSLHVAGQLQAACNYQPNLMSNCQGYLTGYSRLVAQFSCSGDAPFAFRLTGATSETDSGSPSGSSLVDAIVDLAITDPVTGDADVVFGVSASWDNTLGTALAGPATGTNSGIIVPGSNCEIRAQAYIPELGYDSTQEFATARSVTFTFDVKPASALPAFVDFNFSVDGTPVTTANAWHFTASYPNGTPELTLKVQSTLTPGDDGSWVDLPVNPFMSYTNSNWTLDTTGVPGGDRSFRAIASAPFTYSNVVSTMRGPISILNVLPPFVDFSVTPWSVNALSEVLPFGTWWFTAKVLAIEAVGGVRTHLQWSAAPNDTNSWQDCRTGRTSAVSCTRPTFLPARFSSVRRLRRRGTWTVIRRCGGPTASRRPSSSKPRSSPGIRPLLWRGSSMARAASTYGSR